MFNGASAAVFDIVQQNYHKGVQAKLMSERKKFIFITAIKARIVFMARDIIERNLAEKHAHELGPRRSNSIIRDQTIENHE